VKRILMVFMVALLMMAMIVAISAPAFAAKGPFVGQPDGATGKQACLQTQTYNNPINGQYTCAGNPGF
jgi:hypothetical protein